MSSIKRNFRSKFWDTVMSRVPNPRFIVSIDPGYATGIVYADLESPMMTGRTVISDALDRTLCVNDLKRRSEEQQLDVVLFESIPPNARAATVKDQYFWLFELESKLPDVFKVQIRASDWKPWAQHVIRKDVPGDTRHERDAFKMLLYFLARTGDQRWRKWQS